MSLRVGFVGLGVMGSPMAGHLAGAGHRLTVLDLDHARAEALAAAYPGMQTARTPREVAAASDVVFTMLPDGHHVKSVALGADGLIEGFAAGALLVDTSSSEPWLTLQTAAALREHGVGMVDAATSGAEWGAKAADLVFMMGGEAADIARATPLLEAMGKRRFHLGPVSAGHAMKSINNLITAVTLAATAEGMVIGKKLGLDPDVMTDVLNVSTGMSWISQTHFHQRITSRTFDDPFRLALMLKDMRCALALATEQQLQTPLSTLATDIYASADAHGPERGSISEVVRYIENENGVRIEP